MVLVGLAVAVSTGCQIAYPIPRDQIRASLPRYYDATSACAETAPPQQFVHTGHRVGNPDAYARSLNGARPDPPQPAPIADLMDHSFGELGLTAIEFDVRSSPLPGDQSVVVVHDPIKPGSLSEVARTYMSANTLQRVLEHFVAREYYLAGYRLLIELKVPWGPELDAASRIRPPDPGPGSSIAPRSNSAWVCVQSPPVRLFHQGRTGGRTSHRRQRHRLSRQA